ncbi:hypothetical protein MTO96_010557 [Rhipicephalus appendiculatus]
MSELSHPVYTDSEEQSESTTSFHASYGDKQPDKPSIASTPASVETPSQQHSSLRDSDATPTPDIAQDSDPALVPHVQDGCDALSYSFAKFVSSLTDALNACCGTSPPPAPPDRRTDPGGKNAEAQSSSEETDPQKRDAEESAAGEAAKNESVGDSAKSRNFLDDLAMDHRSPAELLEVDQRDKAEEELDEKLLQYQMLRQAGELSDSTELDHLEKEKEELLSSPLTAFSPPLKEKEDAVDDEKFAVHLVHVSPYGPATPVATDEQATPPSNGEPANGDALPPPPDAAGSTSPATPAAQQDGAREHDAEELSEELDHGEGVRFEDGVKEGKQEVQVEEEVDGVKEGKQEVQVDKEVDAASEAGAVGDAGRVAPSYLPPDAVHKIPDLPKGPASAVVSPESGQVLSRHSHAAGTQDTELIFRYKTPLGFTVTLLFLASVVVFTVAIGQFTARNGQSESLREATTLLSFPEWNKSDNGRVQLMIPEEETERDILTLDIN